MTVSLEKKMVRAIHEHQMFSAGDRVGVAVSGGADSVALLRLLQGLQSRLGIQLAVLHFDHQLRGAESKADADFVCALARESSVPFFMGRADVAAEAKQHHWNLEDAGRRLRYKFFNKLLDEKLVARVAVAHTADDQAETVLAHIFRGTGPAGLAGIYPAVNGVIRPLIGVGREELRDYLRGTGQPWREDASNLDILRQRARIRHQLVPALKQNFCPELNERLGKLAELAREEQEFWDALVEDRCSSLTKSSSAGIVIPIGDLLTPLPLARGQSSGKHRGSTHLRALTERIIRRLYQKSRGVSQDLAAIHVAQVIRLAAGSTGSKRIQLPGRVIVERRLDQLRFSTGSLRRQVSNRQETNFPDQPYHYVVDWAIDRETAVAVPELGTLFRLKVIDWPTLERDTKRVEAALDADLFQHPVFLRSWQPGDAYRPKGRSAAKKLKEMFLQARVPASERRRWPVIESQGKIAWVREMPPADEFCANHRTRTAVVVEEEQL